MAIKPHERVGTSSNLHKENSVELTILDAFVTVLEINFFCSSVHTFLSERDPLSEQALTWAGA